MAFPSNPSLNELYPTTVDPGERQWIWNGYAWDTVSGASGVYVGTTELQFNNSPTPQHLTGILSIDGLAASATALATARTINGTAFNGTANITTANWGTGRTLTIGATGKSVNGSANVSWSLAEIGAASTAQGALADTAVQPDQLATVATTGSYTDLINKPTIPAAQVNSDWNATSGVAQILNKPTTLAGYGITDALNAGLLAVADGVASLDSAGKIPATQLPAIVLTDTFVVASELDQLALVVEQGDVAVRTDLSKSFIQNGGTAGDMTDWTELLSPTGGGVSSVAMSVPTGLNVSGSPITSTGTLAVSYAAGYTGFTSAEATKLAGIAAGATVGATWGTNLSSIPANITSWAGIAPSNKVNVAGDTMTGALIVNTEDKVAVRDRELLRILHTSSTTDQVYYEAIGDGGDFARGNYRFGTMPTIADALTNNRTFSWAFGVENATGYLEARTGVAAPSFLTSVQGRGNGQILQWIGDGTNFDGICRVGHDYCYAPAGTTRNTLQLVFGPASESKLMFMDSCGGQKGSVDMAGNWIFNGTGTFTGTLSASNLSGTNTGDQTITLTGAVTGSGTSSFSTTLSTGVVANTNLANVATATIKGRVSASTGVVEDLTAAQVRTLLNVADGATANTGTVTSVGLSMPLGFQWGGSPITNSGTLAVTYAAGYQGYTTTEAGKLSGIADGATVGADWNTNLSNIPANIIGWAGYAPENKVNSGYAFNDAFTSPIPVWNNLTYDLNNLLSGNKTLANHLALNVPPMYSGATYYYVESRATFVPSTSVQIAHSYNATSPEMLMRHYATEWSPWVRFWNSGNFANGDASQYIRGDGSLATLDYAAIGGTVPTWNQNTTGSAATLTTPRTLTIGSTGKTFNGGANVSWSLAEIGALPLTGGTLTGAVTGTTAEFTTVKMRLPSIVANANTTFSTTHLNCIVKKNNTTAYTYTIPSALGTDDDTITVFNAGSSNDITVVGSSVTLYENGLIVSNVIVKPYTSVTFLRAASGIWVV